MKEIEGFPGYFITEDGQVFSKKSNKFLKLNHHRQGYREAILSNNNQPTHCKVHQLVAKAFVDNPNPENYNQVNHINGIKHDNHFTNLEWCNHSMNMRSYQPCHKNNSTGIPGVILEIIGERIIYRASWVDFSGKCHRKSFSVNLYGEDEAKRLAIDYRKKMEELYYFKPNAHQNCASMTED